MRLYPCISADSEVQFESVRRCFRNAERRRSMQDWTPREHYTAEDLVEIIRILRDRENGCPWDKVQTHASIRKNFLEETCEALEAIDADDPVMMQEELGDVLMQVVFHTVIEEERGRFDMEKVLRKKPMKN